MKRKREQVFGRNSLKIVQFYFAQVNRVVDAMKPVMVEVTQKDQRQARVKDPNNCAFALACVRSFDADGVIIGSTTSYIIIGRTATRFKNPESLTREIVSFDRKAGFDAGVYHLAPPAPSNRLGVRPRSGPRNKSNGKSRRRFLHFTTGIRVLGPGGVPRIS